MRPWLRLLVGALLATTVAACARPGTGDASVRAAPPAAADGTASATPTPAPGAVDAEARPVDVRCDTDADCAVKDVGSCCGYFPRCVNKDSPTFPEQVQAQCAREGRVGVCGFPEVAGCRCVNHECVNEPGAAGAPAVQE